jgi:hypothetical protein
MNVEQIIATLDNFQNIDDIKQLDDMACAVAQLYDPPQVVAVEALFRILERFPEDDGYETFWSILTTLERTPNYEPELVKSIMRQPNEFNVIMINRMLNAGIHHIDDTNLIDLLRHVVKDDRTPKRVARLTKKYIQQHGI